jgi:carbon-monoxide dehydrogenase medium subunit
MYEFTYRRVDSVAAAVEALRSTPDPKLLAGGMTLLPTMKQRLARPSHLIDISAIGELRGVRRESGHVVIGAMTTHCEVAESADVAELIPALAKLAGHIGDPQVRNRGTLGGSIANADPAADYPAALVGLGASVQTSSRTIAADDFFVGLFETALEEHEIVKSVSFPVAKRAAYMKFPNPASRYAIVGVFVAETSAGMRVAVTGAGASVFRVPEMEQALAKRFAPESVAGVRVSDAGLNADIHASAEYRAHLVTVMAKRAVAAAG